MGVLPVGAVVGVVVGDYDDGRRCSWQGLGGLGLDGEVS
jgi:hypothetical protein